MQSYSDFYQNINLPSFAPPEWVFGLAWGIIYPLLIIATGYLVFLVIKKRMPFYLLGILFINILANLLFTPILLGMENLFLATVDIWVVLVTLAFFQYLIYGRSKIIFFLLLPYLLWGAFATALQGAIFLMN